MLKKTIGLYLLSLLGVSTTAQTLDICSGYSRLIDESKTKFSSIATPDSSSSKNNKRNSTNLIIENSTTCYLETASSGFEYFAEFGNFETKEEAIGKIKSIQSELIDCARKLEFVENTNPFTKLPYFYIKEKFKDGFRFHKMTLGILMKEKKFIPFMEVPENALITTYGILVNNSDTTLLSSEIKKVLAEAKNGFDNFVGPQNKKVANIYKSTFCITDTYGCIIEDLMSEKRYKAFAATALPEADAASALEILGSSVASAIGKNFVWSKSKEGDSYDFYESGKISPFCVPLISVKKEKLDEGKYNIVIVVKETPKLKY